MGQSSLGVDKNEKIKCDNVICQLLFIIYDQHLLCYRLKKIKFGFSTSEVATK